LPDAVELDVLADDDLPEWLLGDAPRIRQIVVNLVGNAVKFTDQGTVTVRIHRKPLENATLVRIEVSDTGIGIDPEQLSRLFEPFEQAERSTERRYGGTGLGLTICVQLVEMMHGTIGAHSTRGQGSTFWVELPLAPARAESEYTLRTLATPTISSARDAAGLLTDSAPLVLVVEDNAVNRVLAVRMLDRCGYRAHVANNGKEALVATQQTAYAAVLMDCQMPIVDGYRATRAIRQLEHDGEHLPIIAMTAHSMASDRGKCIAAGMDDYLSKPIRMPALTDILARYIPSQPQPEPMRADRSKPARQHG